MIYSHLMNLFSGVTRYPESGGFIIMSAVSFNKEKTSGHLPLLDWPVKSAQVES
jgi:hypothetical protein